MLRVNKKDVSLWGNQNGNMMKAYRYNCTDRNLRGFNNCGKEKNPNAIKFYASNLDYAKKYDTIYDADGYEVEKCTLEVVELPSLNLFDMVANHESLSTYQSYRAEKKSIFTSEFEYHVANAKNAKQRKMFANTLANIDAFTEQQMDVVRKGEFQSLSDFEIQNDLVAELKSIGFDGYFTNNEIAIF